MFDSICFDQDLVRSVKKVTGLTGGYGSGDLPYDVMLSWREMQDRNQRLQKQTKVYQSLFKNL